MIKKRSILLPLILILFIQYVSAAGQCDNLTTNITIQIDDTPYLNNEIEFLGILPNTHATHNVSCWSIVSKDGEIQQTNPQKTEFSKTFFSLPKKVEQRDQFSSENGIVNAYFTDNLLSYEEFLLTLRCASNTNGDVLVGQTCVTPSYQDLRKVTARGAWAVNELEILLWVIVILILVILIILFIWRSFR